MCTVSRVQNGLPHVIASSSLHRRFCSVQSQSRNTSLGFVHEFARACRDAASGLAHARSRAGRAAERHEGASASASDASLRYPHEVSPQSVSQTELKAVVETGRQLEAVAVEQLLSSQLHSPAEEFRSAVSALSPRNGLRTASADTLDSKTKRQRRLAAVGATLGRADVLSVALLKRLEDAGVARLDLRAPGDFLSANSSESFLRNDRDALKAGSDGLQKVQSAEAPHADAGKPAAGTGQDQYAQRQLLDDVDLMERVVSSAPIMRLSLAPKLQEPSPGTNAQGSLGSSSREQQPLDTRAASEPQGVQKNKHLDPSSSEPKLRRTEPPKGENPRCHQMQQRQQQRVDSLAGALAQLTASDVHNHIVTYLLENEAQHTSIKTVGERWPKAFKERFGKLLHFLQGHPDVVLFGIANGRQIHQQVLHRERVSARDWQLLADGQPIPFGQQHGKSVHPSMTEAGRENGVTLPRDPSPAHAQPLVGKPFAGQEMDPDDLLHEVAVLLDAAARMLAMREVSGRQQAEAVLQMVSSVHRMAASLNCVAGALASWMLPAGPKYVADRKQHEAVLRRSSAIASLAIRGCAHVTLGLQDALLSSCDEIGIGIDAGSEASWRFVDCAALLEESMQFLPDAANTSASDKDVLDALSRAKHAVASASLALTASCPDSSWECMARSQQAAAVANALSACAAAGVLPEGSLAELQQANVDWGVIHPGAAVSDHPLEQDAGYTSDGVAPVSMLTRLILRPLSIEATGDSRPDDGGYVYDLDCVSTLLGASGASSAFQPASRRALEPSSSVASKRRRKAKRLNPQKAGRKLAKEREDKAIFRKVIMERDLPACDESTLAAVRRVLKPSSLNRMHRLLEEACGLGATWSSLDRVAPNRGGGEQARQGVFSCAAEEKLAQAELEGGLEQLIRFPSIDQLLTSIRWGARSLRGPHPFAPAVSTAAPSIMTGSSRGPSLAPRPLDGGMRNLELLCGLLAVDREAYQGHFSDPSSRAELEGDPVGKALCALHDCGLFDSQGPFKDPLHARRLHSTVAAAQFAERYGPSWGVEIGGRASFGDRTVGVAGALADSLAKHAAAATPASLVASSLVEGQMSVESYGWCDVSKYPKGGLSTADLLASVSVSGGDTFLLHDCKDEDDQHRLLVPVRVLLQGRDFIVSGPSRTSQRQGSSGLRAAVQYSSVESSPMQVRFTAAETLRQSIEARLSGIPAAALLCRSVAAANRLDGTLWMGSEEEVQRVADLQPDLEQSLQEEPWHRAFRSRQ